jgi:ribonuclease P protein component
MASPLVHPATICTRVGLIVPRFRHTAVARNRLKRRLRELSRTRLLQSEISADVVIRIRPEAYRASFAELTAEVEQALTLLRKWHVAASRDDAKGRATGEGPTTLSDT